MVVQSGSAANRRKCTDHLGPTLYFQIIGNHEIKVNTFLQLQHNLNRTFVFTTSPETTASYV